MAVFVLKHKFAIFLPMKCEVQMARYNNRDCLSEKGPKEGFFKVLYSLILYKPGISSTNGILCTEDRTICHGVVRR